MKIDLLRNNLRHIVLLAKEYNEKISDSLDPKIKELNATRYNESEMNYYDSKSLVVLKVEKKKIQTDIYKQVAYCAEKIFLEFTKPFSRAYKVEIDLNQINALKSTLTPGEFIFLKQLYELYCDLENLRSKKINIEQDSGIEVIEPEIDELMDCALKLSS